MTNPSEEFFVEEVDAEIFDHLFPLDKRSLAELESSKD
jgi:hypothetical protein